MPLTTTRLAALIFKRRIHTARRYSSVNSAPDPVETDVVIIGGGVAGLALASALGSSPSIQKRITVTLVEGGDLEKVKTWNPSPNQFSNRVVSLTNYSKSFLKGTGVWNFVDKKRICALEQMQVWDGVSDARIGFNSDDLPSETAVDGMATLIENFNLQRALLRHLDEIPTIRILQRTRVLSIIEPDEGRHGPWPLVHLDNDMVLRARLLVGADGFNSPVRTFAQILSYGWSYNTQAVVCTMVHPPRGAFEAPNATAYQRFLPTGPIAFLPLTPTISSLVWSTTPALAAALLACDPAVLSMMINAAFRLPNISMKYVHNLILTAHSKGTPISPEGLMEEIRFREMSHGIDEHSAYSALRKTDQQGVPPSESEAVPPLVTSVQKGTMASFPIRYQHAESYLGEGSRARTVLVGDAAHTIHPLAGQGMNLGLADVECLTRCIKNSLETGGDIGSYTSLLPYAQKRYVANHILMSAVDKLHKLYGTDDETVVWARSIGVEVLNELDSIKAAMMMFAGAEGSISGDARSTAWNCAGNAVEAMAGTVKTAGILRDVISGALGTAVSNLAKSGRP